MEIILELFLTAFIALVFSFLIAKIVSLATGGDAGGGGGGGGDDDKIIMEQLEFAEKLKVSSFESEKKVDFVKESGDDNKVVVLESVDDDDDDDQGFKSETKVDELEGGDSEEVIERSKLESFVQETDKKIGGFEAEVERIGQEIEAENKTKFQPQEIRTEESQMKVLGEEEKEVKLENYEDEDDDWEGIEKSELEEVFGSASKFIEQEGDLGIGNDVQMELYGLHKVATEGPCHEPQPLAFMVASRSKWNAWQKLGNMSPEAAMEQYVALVSDKVPGWTKDTSDGERKLESADQGVAGSVAPDIDSFPDKQAIFMHERNADSNTAPAGGDITESASREKQAKD
ncbi:hypothetical protein ES319_A06G025600v1 [Gossypium barbadense]|uniref:ACB domain-containing protein n=2 Tax=Gossypium TaxID=3633 RepID=A0A5J5V8G0_GOSBA|nr:hypothetical protein ES319_A06G025600v1 [Gossypium barbadense]TYH11945.1 hypothetical protein ES288_A06G026500v1 [Gossypium darwinii]